MTAQIKPVVGNAVNASPQFHCLGGQFRIGGTTIPYLTAHLTLAQAALYLKTPRELPGWSQGETELEALYQRQLDYRRVKHKILPYLSNPSSTRPRFFNSITIALVPYKKHQICGFDGSFKAPALHSTGTTASVTTGPLTLGLYRNYEPGNPDCMALGEFAWNLDETACVAIDGQHRLEAIKQLYKKDPSQGEGTRICVIFLVPSHDLGYASPEDGDLLRLLRSVFIDLNKHAQTVKRARLILLDDLDPHSLGVRRLVGGVLRDVTLPNVLEEGDRLPLALVDWHSDDAKFDQGPYVTSILALDRALQLLLGAKPITDWSSTAAIKLQIQALRGIGFEPSAECMASLDAAVQAEESWQASFAYPADDLRAIADAVGQRIAPVVGYVLTNLRPYQSLIEHRSESGLLSASFSNWYECFAIAAKDDSDDAARDLTAIKERIQAQPNPPNIGQWEHFIREEVSHVKGARDGQGRAPLAFKVVFQGAIFQALEQLSRRSFAVLAEESSLPEQGTHEHLMAWTETLVDAFNAVHDADEEFFDLRHTFRGGEGQTLFWLGSVLSLSSQNVDYANTAMERTSYWLVLLAMLYHAREKWTAAGLGPAKAKVEGFLQQLEEQDEDYAKRISQTLAKIRDGSQNNQGSMGRIAWSLQQDGTEEDLAAESEKQLAVRYQRIWHLLRKAER